MSRIATAEQRLGPEEDEVRGSRDAYCEERRLGRAEDRGEPDARRQRPEGLAGGDTRRGQDTGSSSAEERVADGERRVLAGRDDHEAGDPEER